MGVTAYLRSVEAGLIATKFKRVALGKVVQK